MMNKQKKPKWQRKVNNKMRLYGETNFDKNVIQINKKKSKNNPSRTRPVNKGAHKYPDVLDTIVHEEMHRQHPDMHERTVRKKTLVKVKKISRKVKVKLYARYK